MAGSRILFAHSPEGRETLRKRLETAGCVVETASTATEAIERLATDRFDCLVSEFELPGDDGLALGSAVDRLAPELPFVLLAAAEHADSVDGVADHVVRKNGAESVDRLLSAVRSHRSTAEPTGPKQDISGHEPTADDLARAIQEAPIGISLSDPSLSDYPVVYANDAWEEVTGYDSKAMLGRNPRLLQGPQTDPETVDRISTAIDNEEPVTVEIRNYKREGTPFWNELTVAPVYDDGELAHYVGFQMDVTDRREAETLAEERARKLDDQQQALRRVLNRVNGLLSEVSGILAESTDAETLAYRVCDAVASEPGYAAAWTGTVDPSGTTLELTASAGLPTDTSCELPVDSLSPAVQRAVETEEVQWESETDAGTPLDPGRVGARQLLVVPLCYGERRYGLLGVYGTDAGLFDGREQELLVSLGRMVANGLHAVEATRLLTTDHVTELDVEIRDESFELVAIAEAVGGAVERNGTTQTDDGGCELYLSTESTVEPSQLESLSFVEAARTVVETDAETTLSVRLSAVDPDDRLAEAGAVVTGGVATDQQARLTIEAPPQQDVRSVLDTLRSSYETVELRARTERDRRERRPEAFAAAVGDRLTDRQQAALRAAHLNGYFEWPRPVDGEEIAETMGITRQTFHQHLRAAQGKLVEAYIEAC